MRLIGGRDYYDNGLAYGRDNSLVFVRQKDCLAPLTSIAVKPVPRLSYRIDGRVFSVLPTKDGDLKPQPVTVVFCGKVYHGMLIREINKVTAYWSLDKFKERLASMNAVPHISSWLDRRAELSIVFQAYDAPRATLDHLIESKITVAIYIGSVGQWQVNPYTLKDVEFYKVMDAFSAFQEIAMWVGGVLPGNSNPMVEVSDLVRIEKHGFDKVRSFRNM